ncbi:hypothetical protein K2173_026338 [Erythroxylum novogranatense]|uniref:Peroxisome biogenesis protein 3-2-like n=1 Tax=Erythroxylum novogranatense TaxID=1862640 RepID=A0AAV8SMZ2_9ROSI|nr:hypothetical protein K2173_026338 [Erythroxylum novogranatense]
MLYLSNFWRRHRRKIFIAAGVFGGGYFLYNLYRAQKRRLADLERTLASERENEELIKAQMQAHFENIQGIADTTILPHVIQHVSDRIAEDLDLSNLTERLRRGRVHPSTLTSSQKVELWDRLKILSFTRMLVSLWSMTALTLYIRVQVNILGRHLYVDTARSLEISHSLEDHDLIDRDDEQKFLASADFLASNGLPALISNMQAAVTEELEGKQLGDLFNTTTLHGTIMQILHVLMSTGSPHMWVDCLMPEVGNRRGTSSSSGDTIQFETTKFDQFMLEVRAVLLSSEFSRIMDISLQAAVDGLVDEIGSQVSGTSMTTGIELARLVPRVAQMGPTLLVEPSQNQFMKTIRRVPEVELFFTLLYANMPTSWTSEH